MQNDCLVFDKPSLKQETPGSVAVERLSSEKVQPIEASKPKKGRKMRFMPFQNCCSDEVCKWKPLAVTSPFRVRSQKGEWVYTGAVADAGRPAEENAVQPQLCYCKETYRCPPCNSRDVEAYILSKNPATE